MMTANPNRGMRWRRIRLFVLSGILVLLALHAGVDVWTGRRIAAEVSRLEQSYGPLDDVGVETVPAADNRARVVVAAASLTVPDAGTSETDFGTAFSRFNRLTTLEPVPPELRAFVEANREAIRLAGEARSRSKSSFEVDYPAATRQAPLLDIRTLSSAIYLSALMELDADRADDAADAITTGLVTSASLGQEPQLIAQLIRMSVALQHLAATQRLITDAEPSAAALDDLARWLADARAPDPIHTGLLGELKAFHAGFVAAEEGRRGPAGRPSLLPSSLARISRPLVRLAHLSYLRKMGSLLDVQAGPRPRQALPEIPDDTWFDWLMSGAIPGMLRTIVTGDDFNSQLGVTEIAVALRRFKIAHGAYPEDLSALVPEYLDHLPIDPYTGQPPVYAQRADGFTLQARGREDLPASAKRALQWSVSR